MSSRALRSIQKAGQFTALVDILFATIGIFVIVFALQDLDPPVDLLPAPYDAVVTCAEDRNLRFFRAEAEGPQIFGPRDIARDLRDVLDEGGRILVALSANCVIDTGDGIVVSDRLRDVERSLTERTGAEAKALLLMEYAPLEAGGEKTLIARFLSERTEAGE